MKSATSLSAETLGQIALIQSMVVHLPDLESILGFVCRGLEIVPGADQIDYRLQEPDSTEKPCLKENLPTRPCFALEFNGRAFGSLLFHLSAPDMFTPYAPYIENLCQMLAVMFEERRQRRRNEAYQDKLEQRVYARTRQLENEVREHERSRQLLYSLVNNTRNVIYIKDLQGHYTLVNESFCEIFNLDRRQIIGATPEDLFPQEVARQHQNNDRAIISAKTPLTFTEFAQTASGRRDYISVKFPIMDDAGNVKAVGGISTDITEIKQTENALRLDEARLEALLKLNQLALASMDEITRFALQEAIRLTGSRIGYLGLISKDKARLTISAWSKEGQDDGQIPKHEVEFAVDDPGFWHETIRQRTPIVINDLQPTDAVLGGYPQGHDHVHRHMDIPVLDGDRIVAVAGVGNKRQPYDKADVRQLTLLMQGMWRLIQRIRTGDEKRELEKRIRQAYKMEAIGTLAGGIAHDFNNILSALLGYTEISLMEITPGTPLQAHLEKVLQAGKRARDLVGQILTFSRQSEQALMPIQITPIVKEALKFIRASLSSSIEIRQNLQGNPTVMADATQFHQVLMNLCTNAGHAMGEGGGTLDVRLENLVLDAEFTQRNPGLEPGRHMKLTVSDTGHGISPELMERIFDPFFTTKEKGEGTGMGLSVVHGIVKTHGGIINVYSEKGKGSVFNVFLPSIEKRAVKDVITETKLTRGNERILFVDDEAPLVELGINLLGGLGYQVTGVSSSVDALDLFGKAPDQFDLVITDMAMPKINGEGLAREVLKINPHMPIIMCTGFSASMNEEKALEIGIQAFIHKPILRHKISTTVRDVLDRNRSNGHVFSPTS